LVRVQALITVNPLLPLLPLLLLLLLLLPPCAPGWRTFVTAAA
jgi:hypothetical protein